MLWPRELVQLPVLDEKLVGIQSKGDSAQCGVSTSFT